LPHDDGGKNVNIEMLVKLHLPHRLPLWYFEAYGPKTINVMIQMQDGKIILKKT
jgi:hypothetical protein